MNDLITAATASRRFQTFIFTAFAGVALFLSLVDLYSLMTYSVRRRTFEIAVRLALGAQPVDVLRMILRCGLSLTVFGSAIGLALGAALSRLVSRFLFGVRALDPLTLAAAITLLVSVSLLACLVPALRAANTDPMVALRHEGVKAKR